MIDPSINQLLHMRDPINVTDAVRLQSRSPFPCGFPKIEGFSKSSKFLIIRDKSIKPINLVEAVEFR